jgi:magnesium-protoporphyrin O-methyltransferase
MLLRVIKEQGVEGASVLDIGGGIGTIQHELLRVGASRATGAEAAMEFVEVVQEEARRQGHADKIDVRYGDFVEIVDDIEEADIVTLDRVICCYSDMESLVKLSTKKARRVYGVVYPRDTFLTRIGMMVLNAVFRLTRNPFRVYRHATADVEALIFAAGFRQTYYKTTPYWQVAVFCRR